MRVALPMLNDARQGPAPAPFVPYDSAAGLSLDDGPEAEDVREALIRVLDGLRSYEVGGAPIVFSLREPRRGHRSGLRPDEPGSAPSPGAVTDLVRALGDGEVSAIVTGSGALSLRETSLPGVWRVEDEFLEVCDVPSVVRAADAEATRPELVLGPPPRDAMNVMPVLAELRHRALAWRPGEANHVISLTLLPMSEVDMIHLEDQLGEGPVLAESTGYGLCKVALTAHRHIWRVQYRSAMGGVLLDTLEVGDVPDALTAAVEDIRDSAERLAELLGV